MTKLPTTQLALFHPAIEPTVEPTVEPAGGPGWFLVPIEPPPPPGGRKGRRRSACRFPGCTAYKQTGRGGLQYCERHATIDSRTLTFECQLCHGPIHMRYHSAQTHNRQVSRPRPRLCGPCSTPHLARLVQFRRHSVPVAEQLRFMRNYTCKACGERFDPAATAYDIHVDHDHTCCPGDVSCGRCVRGIVHRSCNFIEGQARSPDQLRAIADYMESFFRP